MKTIKLLTIATVLLFAGQISAQNVGDKAPDFTLNSVSGGSFDLSDNMGKVVFIFTFGNSCAHCIANGPNTESDIYDVYKNDANFVAVGVDAWNGSAGQVQSYQVSTGISYPLLLNGGTMVSNYNSTYDRMIIVDQEGIIRYKEESYATSAAVARASAVIEGLLQTAGTEDIHASKAILEAAYVSSQNTLRINNPFGHDAQVTYRVMDMSGRIVQQSYVHLSETNMIQLNAPSSGLNFISLSDGQNSYTAKFIR